MILITKERWLKHVSVQKSWGTLDQYILNQDISKWCFPGRSLVHGGSWPAKQKLNHEATQDHFWHDHLDF